MTRTKKLVGLLAVLALLIGATIAVTVLTRETEDTTEESITYTVLEVDSDSVTALSWTTAQETVSLSKTDDGWEDPDDPALPVDADYPDTMVSTLSCITAGRMIEAPESLADYGLEDPNFTVTITADATYELAIGNETSLGGEVYVSIGDGNVYLADSTLLTAFDYGRYDIISYESIPSMTDITSVTVSAGETVLTLCYLEESGIAYSDDYVWFCSSDGEYLTLGTSETESFVGNITGLSWLTCVDYDAQELSDYGLDNPSVTVTIEYIETVTVETSETDEDGNAITEERQDEATFTLELGSTTDEGCYARLAGSGMVYLVSAALPDTLMYTTYEELRTTEVFIMDWDDVTGFDVVLDGQTYSITMTTETVVVESEDSSEEETTAEETVFRLNGEALDTDSVDALLTSLTDLSSTGSASATDTDRTQEIRFIFYRDSESWPQVELAFYTYDSASRLVEVAGEIRLLVDRTAIADIVAAAQALLTE